MSNFIHYSLDYEATYLESKQASLIESKFGILNFDIRNNLPKKLNIDPLIPQLHFDSFNKKKAINESDLNFIVHGSDVVGMWERSAGFHRHANYYRFLHDASVLLETIKAFVVENDIKEVWYNMVPHGFEEYLFATTVEKLGGKIYYLSPAFFPWAQTLWKGLMSKERVNKFKSSLTKGHAEKIIKLKGQIKSPAVQLQKSQNKAFKFHRLALSNPLDLVKRIPLLLWKREYKKYSVRKPRKSSIIVYLHYQPEATSLPFFGPLLAQFSVIRRLTELRLKPVYIKEHPNQFMETPPVKSRARWLGLYKDLHDHYDVKFLDMHFSIDEAIENDAIIFSIGGSVVFEYLLKGGDVIVPGDTPLIADESFLALGLKSIGHALYRMSPTDLNSLVEIEKNSSITLADGKLYNSPEDRFKIIVDCAFE